MMNKLRYLNIILSHDFSGYVLTCLNFQLLKFMELKRLFSIRTSIVMAIMELKL